MAHLGGQGPQMPPRCLSVWDRRHGFVICNSCFMCVMVTCAAGRLCLAAVTPGTLLVNNKTQGEQKMHWSSLQKWVISGYWLFALRGSMLIP